MPASRRERLVAHFVDDGFGAQRVARVHGLREAHLVPAQVGHGRARVVSATETPTIRLNVKQLLTIRLAELGALHVLLVEVQRRGIVRQRAEEQVVRFGHRAPQHVLEAHATLNSS